MQMLPEKDCPSAFPEQYALATIGEHLEPGICNLWISATWGGY